jgi:hypothetical protein
MGEKLDSTELKEKMKKDGHLIQRDAKGYFKKGVSANP